MPNSPATFTAQEQISSNGCQLKISGSGAVEAFKNQMASFRVDVASENVSPEIKVLGPNGQEADYTVDSENKTTYNVSYLPIDVGEYTILVMIDGKPVMNEPLKVSVLDGNQVRTNKISFPCVQFVETRAAGSVDVCGTR